MPYSRLAGTRARAGMIRKIGWPPALIFCRLCHGFKGHNIMKRLRFTIALAAAATTGTFATANAGNEGVYDLGQIHVTAPADSSQQEFDVFGGSTISAQQITRANATTLDKALDLAPGVNFVSGSGSRNESNIYIHGFDRWSVPTSIDGVRIYLPYDNRLDFARFMTGDLSQIQIAKGYVSVLDGPGGMGGAVNLVTKKPERAFEGEWATQADFGNNGAYNGIKTYARAGTRQNDYYLQFSGSWQKTDGWELPFGYQPTAIQDSGRRDFADTKDWNFNFKAGWTPNATDEYSINFIHNEGSKNAPYNVYPNAPNQRPWDWPFWNVQTLSTATKTAIGDDSYVNTKLFWERFANGLRMWDDKAQTLQYSSSAGLSVYNDWSLGGSIEAGHNFGDRDTLKVATHIRRDTHSSWSNFFTDQYGTNAGTTPTSPTCMTSVSNPNIACFTSPNSTFVEDNTSLAVENTFHINKSLDFVQGISNDWVHTRQADDYVLGGYSGGTQYQPYWVHYALADKSAFNWQGALIWRYSDTAKLYANVSDRTRFPTLFERFSTRFGNALSNPDLAPEQATNYQIGWSGQFAPNSQVSVLGYYATVRNMIQGVAVSGTYLDPLGNIQPYSSTQNQNVGSGSRYGIDFAIDYALSATVKVGGNFSYIHNQITNPNDPTFQPTGIPTMKGGAYVAWKPLDGLTLTADVQIANDRWSQGVQNKYVTTGAYTLANVGAEYRLPHDLTVSAGVKNIFDNLYELNWGFPEAGRTYYVSMRQTF